jgi:hypothetical protein
MEPAGATFEHAAVIEVMKNAGSTARVPGVSLQ